MDIKNINNNLANTARLNDANKSPDKSPETGSAPSKAPEDKVTLTSISSQIREIEKRAQTANAANETRIAELKKSINDGSYKVDPAKIADKLIKTELLLAGS